MEEKSKGRGGWRGGVKPKGINQTPISFKLSNELLEPLSNCSNKNETINKAIKNHFINHLFTADNLAVSKRGKLFKIQDVLSGEFWEITEFQFVDALRKLF